MSPPRVVLDTNIIISAIIFGGKPRQVLDLIIDDLAIAFISPLLLSELSDILITKFQFPKDKAQAIDLKIKEKFQLVSPRKNLDLLSDKDDNRVLEAAIEGRCGFIVTGDKELLELETYKNIKIVSAKEFLDIFYEK